MVYGTVFHWKGFAVLVTNRSAETVTLPSRTICNIRYYCVLSVYYEVLYVFKSFTILEIKMSSLLTWKEIRGSEESKLMSCYITDIAIIQLAKKKAFIMCPLRYPCIPFYEIYACK